MYSFLNDYSEGAHPRIMDALYHTNLLQSVGYGEDEYCQKAREVICERVKQDVDVHFLVGGTQTNLTFISHILKDYQAVICCDEGHIQVHETGSIEATGHKIITREHYHGKVTVNMIQDILDCHKDEHMVQPKLVYISQTTELGTYYTRQELSDLYTYTQAHHLYLFVDGARLGSALAIKDAPSMEEIAKHCDAFYIGGTKMGALFGEALVIVNDELKEDFRYQMKQKGAMLAKGRLLGIQFYELLKDHLYEEIGEYENNMANIIRKAFIDAGYPIYEESSTNQIFVDIPYDILHELEKDYLVTHIKEFDNYIRIRIVTSWASDVNEVEKFAKRIYELKS